MNKDLDNFIYTASHDFKAPISNMEGLIKALKDDIYDQIDQDHKKIIDLINSSISRFKNTIQELTEISKAYKNINEDIAKTSFAEVFDEIKNEMSRKIIEAEATFVVDFSCPYVVFSHKNLRSIMANLLSNSIKYRSADRRLEIHISTYQQQEFIVLRVEDNGLGMDPAKKDKAFSLFRRLHTHVEGTGIGLYLVKSIIENTEGKVELESEIGKGTIVKVYFKLKPVI